MSNIAAGNEQFSQIYNTVQDSKSFDALVSAGILPKGFKVIAGEVALPAAAPVAISEVLDASGNQIILSEGQHIVHAVMASDIALTSAGLATLEVGLAATATGAVVESLVPASAFGDVDAGVVAATAPIVGDTNSFVVLDLATAALTSAAATVSVVLVVV